MKKPSKISRFPSGYRIDEPKQSSTPFSDSSEVYPSWPYLIKQFSEALSLSPGQLRKMQPMLDQAGSQFGIIRLDAAQKAKKVFADTIKEIRPFLTAEQQRLVETWQRIEELMSESIKRRTATDRSTFVP